MSRYLLACGVWIALVLPGPAAEVRDPYSWLEEVTGEKALAWVKERNADSARQLTHGKAFAALNERLLKVLDSDKRIPFVSKRGEQLYSFWQDAEHKRGLWRRTTVHEYKKAN